MTYSHMGNPTLPSALSGFTSEFGKGSGGSHLLWSPANCYDYALVLFAVYFVMYFACHCFGQMSVLTVKLSAEFYCLSVTESSYLWRFCHWYESISACFNFRCSTTTAWVLYSQASRAISIGQLHASPHFHIQPINVLVSNGSLVDI